MAKATKVQAEEAGFTTAKDYIAFLDVNEIDHDGFMSLTDDERGEYRRVYFDETLPPEGDEESDDEEKEGKRRLTPDALGFKIDNVKDIADEDLPDFSLVNSKYSEYFKALRDSFDRGVWKKITDVADVDALQQALRNAASKIGVGLDYRYTTDDNDQPDGDVYFKARAKKATKPKGSNGSDATE